MTARIPITHRAARRARPALHFVVMRISDLLLSEFDAEIVKTRKTLERVPSGKGDYTPHAKSMPLGKLAPHIAQLAGFGVAVLTEPGLDFATRTYTGRGRFSRGVVSSPSGRCTSITSSITARSSGSTCG
jgi:hypothetical protein